MNTNCAICLKPVQDSTNIIVAECGHTFHCLCLMTNVAVGCPHCQASDDDDDDEEGFTPIFRFRRFLDADAVEDADNDADADADADNDEAEEEEQWGAESDSCDEFGSGYGAVEDSVDDDTNSLLQDDVLRGFRLFNNLVNGVDHDDADDADEEYYNIRCDPDESIADFHLRT
jgi:hypothetical protein